MLKIPKKVEYALLALSFISDDKNSDYVSTSEIASELGIPYNLLAKILQKLAKQKLIESRQGTAGGYYLSTEPENINIKMVIEALDERIQLTNCMVENPTLDDCNRINDCCIKGPVGKLQDKIEILFVQTNLREIMNESA
jgi:Rrf2 family protein